MAIVTFGGADAVQASMAQDCVVQFGWLSTGEMIGALGLAETTPGTLIRVAHGLGILAGFKDGARAWRARRHCRSLGDFRTVFPVDLRRGTFQRMDINPATAAGRA